MEQIGEIFKSSQASSNYGIGADGRVGLYVPEEYRSWCSSSKENDARAITIECASDAHHPYAFNDKVYAALIDLCVDICKRYGKRKLIWIEDKATALNYEGNEMLLTVHRWFAKKACPGDWMYARMGDLAAKVTAQLVDGVQSLYRVRKSWDDPSSQIGAFRSLENARMMVKDNPGYSIYDEKGRRL